MPDLSTGLPFSPASPRLQALQTLGSQVSSQIGQQAGAQQGQRMAGLQTAVQHAAATGGKLTAGQIQATGGQQEEQAGSIGTQAAQLGQQRLGQVGAMGLQEQFMGNQQELASRKLKLDQDQQAITDKLAGISVDLKTELMDKQLQFSQDEMGRTLFNERQLMDWQLQKTQSQQDLLQYEQKVNDMSQLRMNVLKQSKAVLEQTLTEGSALYNQSLDVQQKRDIVQAQQALAVKIQQEQAKQANRAAQFAGVGSVIGMIAGGVVGGPAGALVGASVGGGVGSAVAGGTDKTNMGPAPQV